MLRWRPSTGTIACWGLAAEVYRRIVHGGEGSAMSFDVSASSGEDPVPFWGSILTEEERSRRKDQVTETFVQACVYYMEQCAENSLHTDMLLDYAAPARPHGFASLFGL